MTAASHARLRAALLSLAAIASSASTRWPAPRPMVAIPAPPPPSTSAPSQLLADGLASPALGVDSARPELRWALPAGLVAQTAVLVTVVDEAGAVVWNKTLATTTLSAQYAGAPLRPATAYSWTVAVLSPVATAPSSPAAFVTGLQGAAAPGSAPLWAPAAGGGGGGGANQSATFVFLRQQARLAQPAAQVASAVAFVTASPQAYFGPVEADNAKLTGAYKLFVNGGLSGMGPGKPSRCGPLCPVQHAAGACTCSPEHLYDARDVTAAVRGGGGGGDGSSVTLALAGFNYPPAAAPQQPTDSRMFLQLEVRFADGSRQTLATGLGAWAAFDATAYMAPRASFGDATWYQAPQECFDARLEPAGWREPGFDASAWPAAARVAPFAAPLVARPALALAVTDDAALITPPLAVERYGDHIFVDFGTDFSGGVCVDAASGVAGAVLTMRVGEEATTDARGERAVLPMRTSNVDAQNWTLRSGAQTICMHEWTQFRYASLTAAEGAAPVSTYGLSVRAWVAYYPALFTPLSAFEAASADANATAFALLDVFGLSYYTRFAQGFDMYFDHVRQRDVYCVEELTIDLLLQYSLSAEFSLQPFTIAYVLNNRPEGYGWAEWPSLAVLEVYSIFLHTGDLSLFVSNYDLLRNFTLAALVNSTTGLWTCPPGSKTLDCNNPEVDWPPSARDGFVFTPTNTVVNAIAFAAMGRFSEMASAAGRADDAALFAARAAALRAAANAALRLPGGAYLDGATTNHSAWHSSVFALGMGLPEAADAPATAAALLARTPARGGAAAACFPSSVWPTQWALEGLFLGDPGDHGRAALELLACAKPDGWAAMLEQGATQAPEAWSPEVKGNLEWGMTWGAAPGDLLPRMVLGVRPLLPGFAAVLLQPQPGLLTLVAGEVPTVRGRVAARFAQALDAGGRATAARLEAVLPGATPATACLPLSACPGARVVVDGAPTAARVDGDYACADLQPAAVSPRVIECGAL